jgi:hypothetical protein
MSYSSWCRRSRPATWWSWIASARIRLPASGRPSPLSAPASFTCRPTALTSARQGTRSGNPIAQTLGTPRLMLRISFAHGHAKLKALLHKASARARETLWTIIGQLLHTFIPGECRNSFTNSGYAFDENENALAAGMQQNAPATVGGQSALTWTSAASSSSFGYRPRSRALPDFGGDAFDLRHKAGHRLPLITEMNPRRRRRLVLEAYPLPPLG